MHNILAWFRNSVELKGLLVGHTVGSMTIDQVNRDQNLPFDELLVPCVSVVLGARTKGLFPGNIFK